TIIILAQLATNDSPAVLERTSVETLLNISPENKAHYDLEKKAIHLLLTGFGDEIHSTVDACKTPHEIWITIERLQNGESLNIQDVKTNLFWEFGRFSSHDAESMKSYYSRCNSKEIAKPITPPSESASEEDNDPEQAKIRISRKTWHSLYKNDNQTGQFRNQRTVTVAGARETVGSQTDQNAKECNDEHVALSNLIANLKLDIDENKKIQKKLKKANKSLTQELKECKSTLEETNRTLGESNSTRDSCLIALQNKQIELEKYKTLN
ncbi:hypothetical protein Tco_1572970, partial [Tanacetum coccineum]